MRGLLMIGAVIAVATYGFGCSGDDASDPWTSSGSGGSSSSTGTAGGGATSSTSTSTSTSTSSGTGGSSNFSCASPDANWVFCEDFEQGGGDFDTWLAGSDFIGGPGTDDRGRVDLVTDHHQSGSYSAFMPASPDSGYQGASLDWYACDGAQASNCALQSFDQLYFRAWIRFADDHAYVHHFMNISGSQPDDYWYHGTAGCMPNGSLAMGTTVDHRTDTHESFFYTYYPGMNCDTNCGNYADVAAICAECANKGLPTCDQQQQCCWGNHYEAATPHYFPVGQWFCFEMMMKANTVGQTDGEMAYWVDGALVHEETSMMWRTSPTLALNRVRVQHYITSGDAESHSNQVWFDDVVVSTQPVGCN